MVEVSNAVGSISRWSGGLLFTEDVYAGVIRIPSLLDTLSPKPWAGYSCRLEGCARSILVVMVNGQCAFADSTGQGLGGGARAAPTEYITPVSPM